MGQSGGRGGGVRGESRTHLRRGASAHSQVCLLREPAPSWPSSSVGDMAGKPCTCFFSAPPDLSLPYAVLPPPGTVELGLRWQ